MGGLPPLANEQVIFEILLCRLFIQRNFMYSLEDFEGVFSFLSQTIATFFSQVMAAIGGNSVGPGLSNHNLTLTLYACILLHH